MPAVVRYAVILACFLAPSASTWAGVYITAKQDPFPLPTAFDKVKYHLGDLTMLLDSVAKQTNKTTSLRQQLLDRVEKELEPRRKNGELSLLERVDLSGCYIRLGRHNEARSILAEVLDEGPKKVKDDAPERFLLLANLAAAYFDGNNELLGRAILKQKEALAAAPEKPPVPGWSPEQWAHYRIAERYFLRLLERRYAETVRAKAASWKAVDALFDNVRFVGEGGEYEAGKLSAESLHELPRDALPIVVQLLYWLPNDPRLYWLYGELLNADGQVNDAYKVLDDLVLNRSLGLVADLRQHRLVLKEAYRVPKDEEPAPPPEEAKPAKPTTTRDWRSLGTGFLAGLLVAAFGGLQLYIWLRRRRGTAAPSRSDRPLSSAALASAGRSEGIVTGDVGHMTAPRDHS
jgi:hypothetical protein